MINTKSLFFEPFDTKLLTGCPNTLGQVSPMNKDILLHNQRKFHGYIVLCLVAQSCPVVCDPVDCNPPGFSVHMDSLGKNTRVGCHALLQGIFPTQELNQGLLHYRWILQQLSHQGSPWTHCHHLILRTLSNLAKAQHYPLNQNGLTQNQVLHLILMVLWLPSVFLPFP